MIDFILEAHRFLVTFLSTVRFISIQMQGIIPLFVSYFLCRFMARTFWLLFLIQESYHFLHFAMKCTGFGFVFCWVNNLYSFFFIFIFFLSLLIYSIITVFKFSLETYYFHLSLTFMGLHCWSRFFPLTHVQLSSLGNSRNQIGRMLAIDSK